ncbi:MAG TPA: hypothetical protein ENN03_09275 [bacterium]|nr:hypothetical protein [bacterium]
MIALKRWIAAGCSLFFLGAVSLNGQVTHPSDPVLRSTGYFPWKNQETKDPATMTREEFEEWKRRRFEQDRTRYTFLTAQEGPVDSKTYRTGPGDELLLHITGAMELQIPLFVTPEGRLFVPSVGEFHVSGMTLENVQEDVVRRAASVYKNCDVGLSLETLRFFRVHVVGEVRFPGTYIAQAAHRVSDAIQEAGGVTERSWKGKIELRHQGGNTDYIDLAAFEQKGILDHNPHLSGGDIVYVPPLSPTGAIVEIEGNLSHAGYYQVVPGEDLMDFLNRVGALQKHSNLARFHVLRPDSRSLSGYRRIQPYEQSVAGDTHFSLQSGDRVVLDSEHVYVRGAVQNPGAYPYVHHMKAIDYAGLAGGDYSSAGYKRVTVYHAASGKTRKGPDVVVEPGDVVHVDSHWTQRFDVIIRIIPTITSLILAAKAAGFFDR